MLPRDRGLWGVKENFQGTSGKLPGNLWIALYNPVRQVPEKSPGNFRGSARKLWEVHGVSRSSGRA